VFVVAEETGSIAAVPEEPVLTVKLAEDIEGLDRITTGSENPIE